ncbi:MAG: hypothetical protein WA996_21600 [Candidatus Promineifilaceae bacterium]
MIQSILAVLAGPFVMVAFDTLLHGLSHAGHGPLEPIWRQAKGERRSRPALLSAIGWHVVADVLLGLLIYVLVVVVGKSDLAWGALLGALVGGIVALYWLHVYSAFETSGKTVAALAVLSLLQITIATIVVTIAYGAS